jgi:predicted ATPase
VSCCAGRGGLNEEVGEALAVEDGARRGAVSRTEVVHQPSDAEHALHLIAAQLRALRNLPAALGAL